MEKQRQRKICRNHYSKDLAEILQRAATDGGVRGVLISVSKVKVTTDLVYCQGLHVSIFPSEKAEELMKGIQSNEPLIKHELAQRTRHQMRRIPELLFYLDDSLEYIDGIEKSLKGEENPN